jgi:hypothetical protein
LLRALRHPWCSFGGDPPSRPTRQRRSAPGGATQRPGADPWIQHAPPGHWVSPKSCRWDLNPGPRPYQGRALPTEPRQQPIRRSFSKVPIRARPTLLDFAQGSRRGGPDFRPRDPRAGDGNRTHVACLEGRYSTIELHPRWAPPRAAGSASRQEGLARARSVGGSGGVALRIGSGSHLGLCRLWAAAVSCPVSCRVVLSRFVVVGVLRRARSSGWSRIRTCEGIATRFTVWPLWPLGYPPVRPVGFNATSALWDPTSPPEGPA